MPYAACHQRELLDIAAGVGKHVNQNFKTINDNWEQLCLCNSSAKCYESNADEADPLLMFEKGIRNERNDTVP